MIHLKKLTFLRNSAIYCEAETLHSFNLIRDLAKGKL